MITLSSVEEVVDALGGRVAVADLLSSHGYPCGPTAVSNWRHPTRGTFPPETFLILIAELKKAKKEAPASLWNIPVPEAAE